MFNLRNLDQIPVHKGMMREPKVCLAPCKGRGKKRYAVTFINQFQLLERVIYITHPSIDRLGASSGCIENTSG